MSVRGTCARCGLEVFIDPLDRDRWRHLAGERIVDADHEPTFGYVMTAEESRALWDRVRTAAGHSEADEDDVEDEEEVGADDVVPPQIPARPATDDELPRNAKSILKVGLAGGGWRCRALFARGTPITAQGKSKLVTVKEALTGENGKPLLSPTGRPRFRNIPTGEYVVHDVVVLTFTRPGEHIWASWEDGKFETAWRYTPGWVDRLTSTRIRTILSAPPEEAS